MHRTVYISPNDLSESSSAALLPVNDAAASPPSAALQTKKENIFNMKCISISHKTARSAERQKCFITEEAAEGLLKKIHTGLKEGQCVLLSTCNRTELYVQAGDRALQGTVLGRLEEMLAETAGERVEWIRRLARRYQGRNAICHLFQVTCGMESMVIGEDEILGQVRDAYIRSQRAGFTGYELNTVFQAALACAKRVKTETMLSRTSVSVATLAANEIFRFLAARKESVSSVLLMGSTGRMGGILLKDLLSKENIRVLATTRSHRGMAQCVAPRVVNVSYQDRYACLDEADVIVSSTAGPHYTVTAGRAAESMKTVKDRLFLDIAMPPDIDGAVGKMEHCRLIALDDIKRLAQENNRRKRQALSDAREILEEDLDRVCKVLLFHNFTEKNVRWRERYVGIPAEKLIYLLRDELDSASFEAVLRVLEQGPGK